MCICYQCEIHFNQLLRGMIFSETPTWNSPIKWEERWDCKKFTSQPLSNIRSDLAQGKYPLLTMWLLSSLIPPHNANYIFCKSSLSTRWILTALFQFAGEKQPQFHILRKLSQDPVQHAMPSEDTPIQLTLLSWPASTPEPQHIREKHDAIWMLLKILWCTTFYSISGVKKWRF